MHKPNSIITSCIRIINVVSLCLLILASGLVTYFIIYPELIGYLKLSIFSVMSGWVLLMMNSDLISKKRRLIKNDRT